MAEVATGTFPTAVILAGGRGTRISHLFPELPKPLVPTAGRPFLHWVTEWLRLRGATDIVYSTGYRAEAIADWVAERGTSGGLHLCCRAEPAPLGTGGGVLNCLTVCGEDILVVNGDSLADCDIAGGLARYRADRLDGMLFGVEMADASRYGTLAVDADDRLTAFHEKRPGAGLINAGIYLFKRSVLADFDASVASSIEFDIIPSLLAAGRRIGVHRSTNVAFLDIGTPETVEQATHFIEDNPQLFSISADR